MTTVNTAVTTTWTKVAEISNLSFLATWNSPATMEVATTATDVAPTVSGHLCKKTTQITRALMGPGYVWMRSIAGTYPATTTVVVTTGNNQQSYTSSITVVRPANTTAYTAGDVVGATAAVLEFTNCGNPNGYISITDADLRIDVSAVPVGMTSFRLHLYDATPVSALADNDSWDLPAGDRATYLGYIDLGTPVDVGSTLFVQTAGDGSKAIKMGSTTSLFGYLVTTTGFTPSSAAVKSIRLNAQGI